MIFAYRSDNQFANQGQVTKGATDNPSFFVDFSDAAINAAVTIQSIGATALSSTGAVATVNWVGTTASSGYIARVDLRTGGSSAGTAAATEGDRARVRVNAIFSSGGPVFFDAFIYIDSTTTYSPV